MTPVRVRGPVWSAVAVLVAACALVPLPFVGGPLFALPLALVLAAIGIGSLLGCYLVVTEREVQLRSGLQITARRIPIAGPADLVVDGHRLVRVSDGKRIAWVGPMSARPEDVAQLRAVIAGAVVR